MWRAGLEGALCSRDSGCHPCKALSCVQAAHSQSSGQTTDVSLSQALSKVAGGAGRMRVGAWGPGPWAEDLSWASAREGWVGSPGCLSPERPTVPRAQEGVTNLEKRGGNGRWQGDVGCSFLCCFARYGLRDCLTLSVFGPLVIILLLMLQLSHVWPVGAVGTSSCVHCVGTSGATGSGLVFQRTGPSQNTF